MLEQAIQELTAEVKALREQLAANAVARNTPVEPASEPAKPKATAAKPAAEKPKAVAAAPKAKSFVEIHQQATKFVAKDPVNKNVIKSINKELGIENLTSIKDNAETLAAYAKKLDAAEAAYESGASSDEPATDL